jgi:hypothetical protein
LQIRRNLEGPYYGCFCDTLAVLGKVTEENDEKYQSEQPVLETEREKQE